ncbi:MAG: Flp pilus assembly complex ATPase component [Proteobacteria bacterium]|nr:Flp pilus assembly complex ATPase component [Pseudomonadota bacterium]
MSRHLGSLFEHKDIVNFLCQTSLFEKCSENELFELVICSEQRSHAKGIDIVPVGWPLGTLGVILYGRAHLMLVDVARTQDVYQIDQLLPGHFFGELSFLYRWSYPLRIVAEEESYSLICDKDVLEEIMQNHASAERALARIVASRFVRLATLGVKANNIPKDSVLAPSIFEFAGMPGEEALEEHIPWVEVGMFNITPDLLQLIPLVLIRKHKMLPLRLRDKKLIVGMVNPRSRQAVHDLRRVLLTVDSQIVAISKDEFEATVKRLRLATEDEADSTLFSDFEAELVYSTDQYQDTGRAQLHQTENIVKLLDSIIAEAIQLGSSDIHIESSPDKVLIRYRVQGSLMRRGEPVDARLAAPIIARIKVLANLDITDRRQPQDGRIFAKLGKRELNFRVSTMPIARGEKVVIRVLESTDAKRPIHQIIFHKQIEKTVRAALSAPYGAMVVAGPTGGGKSTTLYAMINERKMMVPDNNIVTVEDPVEYILQDITQVQVGAKGNMGFSTALRAMMRQDPDVIMIGELRDRDTAVIMVEAALTGHLVMTSMHGNNVLAVIQRLNHFGIDPILLSQAISLIIVQQLAKKLCQNCVSLTEVASTMVESLKERRIISESSGRIQLPVSKGCEACNRTGYHGRMAVQEVMSIDDHIRSALIAGAKPEELVEIAAERKRYVSFAQGAGILIAKQLLSPGDALLLVTE